jgi:hypothetical protein
VRCVCTPVRSRFLTRQTDLCAHEFPRDEYGLLLLSRVNEQLRQYGTRQRVPGKEPVTRVACAIRTSEISGKRQ